MDWLFKRFLCAVKGICEDINPYDSRFEKLCEEYGRLAKIHIKNSCEYGDVYTNDEFAQMVEDSCIIYDDGTGYYIGTDLMKTKEYVDFDEEVIRSKADKYPYVFWYNK